MKPADVTAKYHKAQAKAQPRQGDGSAQAPDQHTKRRFSHARH